MSWNYYSPRKLRMIGISEHTPDMKDLVISGTPVYVAFCKSSKCAGTKMCKGVEKKVRPETEMCPDCGYFLFWKTTTTPKKEDRRNAKKDKCSSELPESQGRNVPIQGNGASLRTPEA